MTVVLRGRYSVMARGAQTLTIFGRVELRCLAESPQECAFLKGGKCRQVRKRDVTNIILLQPMLDPQQGGASVSRCRALTEQILVDLSILHNQQEILVWVGYELDVVDRVAVHHQKIGERALLNDP